MEENNDIGASGTALQWIKNNNNNKKSEEEEDKSVQDDAREKRMNH